MDCGDSLFLPDGVIEKIAQHLVASERRWLFPLMAMAGTSRQWRGVASRLAPQQQLVLDSLHEAEPLHVRAAAFRRASPASQQAFLDSAAGLLSGYGSLEASGAVISDRTIVKAAQRSGASWTSLRLENAAVTDRALLAAAAKAPGLRHMALVGLPGISVRGLTAFLPCTQLASLELSDLHAFDTSVDAVNRQALSVPNILLVARLFQALTGLKELKLAAPASVVFAAIRFCPQLEKLTYTACHPAALHAVVTALPALEKLTSLSLTARAFAIPPDTARLIGRLPLTALRLDSAVYENQSSAHRVALSHIDNDAVKALVDGVCIRWKQFAEPGRNSKAPELAEFKLSLRGATGLAHDAVSTLLRLPVLTELDVSGCSRISAMDKMRLVAKVKAGCEVLAAQARRAGRPVATQSGDVATPMDHGAFFRGERQTFGAGPSGSSASRGGGSGACRALRGF